MPPDVSKAEPMSSEIPHSGDSTFSVNMENSGSRQGVGTFPEGEREDGVYASVMNREPSMGRHGVANGSQINGGNKAKGQDHTYVDIDAKVNPTHGDRKPPLPILLKFVDLKNTVSIKSSTSWSPKKPFKVKRQHGVEKEILHGVTGLVMPGEVLAIMGPSGGGKTTLLNLLGGRGLHGVSGSITYNDTTYNKALKRRMGFVTQDDVLFPHLTVRETLMYAALLRLPSNFTRSQKIKRAEDTIEELGLERCRDTVIGGPFLRGISGGERKRVSIGHEILVDPSLLFLDEPTSGLDSTTALRIIQVIKNIAKAGRTVLTTIHQPSSRLFYMFDKLILLSEGNSIYFGNANGAMDYYSMIGLIPLIAMNPADFLLDLASGNVNDVSIPKTLQQQKVLQIGDATVPAHPSAKDVREYLKQQFDQELAPKEKAKLLALASTKEELKLAVKEKREWSTTWMEQFSVLMVRGLKERRHEYLSWLRFIQVFFISLIVGCLWWRSKRDTEAELTDQIGLIFFFAIFWGMFPLFTAIFTFPQERAMLAKERASDLYRLSAYFLARTLGDLPLDLVMPTIFVLIVYFMTNMYLSPAAFFLTLLTVYLNVITAQGLGFLIGAAMMDVKQATTLASIIMLAFMLTGGYFVQHIPVWMKWLKYISFNFYVYKLLIKVQYSDSELYDCMTATGCKHMSTSPAFHNLDLSGGGMEAWALLLMVLIYRLLAYVALRRMKTGS